MALVRIATFPSTMLWKQSWKRWTMRDPDRRTFSHNLLEVAMVAANVLLLTSWSYLALPKKVLMMSSHSSSVHCLSALMMADLSQPNGPCTNKTCDDLHSSSPPHDQAPLARTRALHFACRPLLDRLGCGVC